MDAGILIIVLFVIVTIFIGAVAYTVTTKKQENREYQDALDDLYKQLQTGKITLQRYNELRMGLEVRYHRTQRDRGF
ncbi:MAG: hypothetical protein MUO73_06220 [Thermoplasmata archaeon]|jgi:uncharacterized membrane protein|nr:hypothetical protein [Thermoplasmata archaeon]